MSANVNFYKARYAPYQARNTKVVWSWKVGDGYSYWGYSVRPEQANNQVELQRIVTSSDNDLNQVTHLTVEVTDPVGPNVRGGGGGLLSFTAIGVS